MLFRTASALAVMTAFTAAPAFAQSGMSDMPGMEMPKNQIASSPWQWHVHGRLSLIADSQSGPRGGDKTLFAGMIMAMANRDFGNNRLDLQAMLSPDPFMGKAGYPLLLQSGETADGATHLVDRQHPHDMIMGLSAKLTHRFGDGSTVFGSVGYPGETPFGPTAFMHRASAEDFPTAPISHHWLDSGHITMGVVTGGFSKGPVTLEVAQFTGREPDQNRFDLDPVRLDSTAVRLWWQVTPDLKAQASWARQVSAEQLEPDVTLRKQSLSAEYGHGPLTATLAWARKQAEHGIEKPADAVLAEAHWAITQKWSALGRFERVYNDELGPEPAWVSKAEIGGMRTFAIDDMTSVNVGLVRQFNAVPDVLKTAYGKHPDGTVAFVTLKFHRMKM